MSREESMQKLTTEFCVLERIWNSAHASFQTTIPRPVALLPEAGAAVFEAVQGTPMTTLLKRQANLLTGPFCMRKMCRVARRCGDWLRSFHAFTAKPVAEHDSGHYVAKLSYWLGKSERRGLETETAKSLWDAANRACENFVTVPVAMAGVHGDFIPQNILVSGNRIFVIDFASFKEPEPIYEDLGLFVAYLRLLAGARPYSGRTILAMTRAFLDGYGADQPTISLNLYVLKAMLMIFADQFESGGGSGAEESEKISRIKVQLARAARDLLGARN